MIMSKLDEIQERLNDWRIEDHYQPNDMIRLLKLLDDITAELKRIDAEQKRLQRGFATIVGVPPSCEDR